MANGILKKSEMKLKNYLEVIENSDATYQNLWDTMRAVLRGKIITLSLFDKRIKNHQVINVTLHLKVQEKEQINSQNSRREEIIKISAEINEIETNKIQKAIKSWLFEQINKFDKPLVMLTKKERKFK